MLLSRLMPHVTFIAPSGERTPVEVPHGMTILEAAHANGVGLPGTCGGSMVCATCHVMICAADRAKLPPPSENEEDTLDLAFGVTDDSRLGCQVTLTDELEGMDIRLAPKVL
jgi:2Fe-2S ferredoxin